jgi:hypothetical protein
MIGDLWLFVVHGTGNTWTRADVPQGIKSVRDLVGYLQRGGRITSPWIQLPERARFTPRVLGSETSQPAGMTVLAQLAEPNKDARHNS